MQELNDLTGSLELEAAGQSDCSPAGCAQIAQHFECSTACSTSTSMQHISAPHPCNTSISMQHIRIHAAHPCTTSMHHIHATHPCSTSMQHIHIHAPHPHPCTTSTSMHHIHIHAPHPHPCTTRHHSLPLNQADACRLRAAASGGSRYDC